MLKIIPISAFTDNYIWILCDNTQQQAMVVDPGDAKPVLSFLEQQKLQLKSIFITHKHYDHSGGVAALLEKFPKTPVYANPVEKISQMTHPVQEGDCITLSMFPHQFQVFNIPAHTTGHIAFYSQPYLFCGDTLFGAGCGRLFEGDAAQMLASLKKLIALPDDTQIYCGHEYTLKNIQFALTVEPNNAALQKRFKTVKALREAGKPTLPSTIGLEKATNPFLRCTSTEIIQNASLHANEQLHTEVDVFRVIREWKDIL